MRCLMRDGGICQVCHTNRAIIAHHVVWVDNDNVNDPAVVWNIDNLVGVCQDCHNRIHTLKHDNSPVPDGYMFDDNGNIIQINNNLIL